MNIIAVKNESYLPYANFDIGEAINKQLLVRNSIQREDGGIFSPSAIHGCSRRCVYQYIMAPKSATDMQASDQWNSVVGTSYHNIIQALLGRGEEYFFQAEVPARHPTLPIAGTADGVLEYPRGSGVRYLIEIKSMSEKRFATVASAKTPYIKNDVVPQANLYQGMLGVPMLIVVLVNKGVSADFKTIMMDFDPEVWQESISVVESLLTNFVDKRVIPPRQKDFGCRWCPYSAACRGDWSWDRCDRRYEK